MPFGFGPRRCGVVLGLRRAVVIGALWLGAFGALAVFECGKEIGVRKSGVGEMVDAVGGAKMVTLDPQDGL